MSRGAEFLSMFPVSFYLWGGVIKGCTGESGQLSNIFIDFHTEVRPVWRKDTCSSEGSCVAGQFHFNDFPPRMHLCDGGITASPRECLCGKNLSFIDFCAFVVEA